MKQMSMELYPARLHRGRGWMGRERGGQNQGWWKGMRK